MDKIATEQEVYNVGQTGMPTANKCCTKQRMEALGCMGINGGENYANNRLIPEGYYKKAEYIITFGVTNNSSILVIEADERVYLTEDRIHHYLHIPEDNVESIKIQVNYSSTPDYGTHNTEIDLLSSSHYKFTKQQALTDNIRLLSLVPPQSTEKYISLYITDSNRTAIIDTNILFDTDQPKEFNIMFVFVKVKK